MSMKQVAYILINEATYTQECFERDNFGLFHLN